MARKLRKKNDTESESGTRQPSPLEESKMGSTMSNGANKQSKMNTSDFKTEARTTPPADQPRPPAEPRAQPQPVKAVKSPQQKCEEVKSELESLEKEIESFSGAKTDRTYRRLEEMLTRCLLKLDEIEKGDESFNQFRRGLINYADRMGQVLDSKGSSEKIESQNNAEITPVKNEPSNANEQPGQKRNRGRPAKAKKPFEKNFEEISQQKRQLILNETKDEEDGSNEIEIVAKKKVNKGCPSKKQRVETIEKDTINEVEKVPEVIKRRRGRRKKN